jgi:UDP-N-acetyl-D-glucosamine dehydrogenase
MSLGDNMELNEKIINKNARCAVVGLGYVGLPLLLEFAKAGYDAVGIDVDKKKIAQINRGKSYIQDIPQDEFKEYVRNGKLRATSDYSILDSIDVVSICVPTPLRKSRTPDISYIVEASSNIVRHLHKGQLIILESTTYPGTTEEIVMPILTGKFHDEEFSEICAGGILREAKRVFSSEKTVWMPVEGLNGASQMPITLPEDKNPIASLKVGEDFYLAFSPERVDPGNEQYKTKDIPKVIGGHTPACTEYALAFYKQIFPDVIPVSSTRSAEMVKLLENTFRSVNIALANEMSVMCDSLDVDVWEVIDAAATKPFGFIPFYPGPGLGGHCIPVDPVYLTWKVRSKGYNPKFVEMANEFNQQIPRYIVAKTQDKLNEAGKSFRGSRILVVGVAYKKDVSDTRESPSIEIIKQLLDKGANISYFDPYVPYVNCNGFSMKSAEYTANELKNFDCVIIATDHSNIDYKLINDNCNLIVDTRNAIRRNCSI